MRILAYLIGVVGITVGIFIFANSGTIYQSLQGAGILLIEQTNQSLLIFSILISLAILGLTWITVNLLRRVGQW